MLETTLPPSVSEVLSHSTELQIHICRGDDKCCLWLMWSCLLPCKQGSKCNISETSNKLHVCFSRVHSLCVFNMCVFWICVLPSRAWNRSLWKMFSNFSARPLTPSAAPAWQASITCRARSVSEENNQNKLYGTPLDQTVFLQQQISNMSLHVYY